MTIQRFGEKLRTLREQRLMTLTELATALGYEGHSYISAIEMGKKQLTVEFVLKVSRLFEISMDQLTRDDLDV